MDDLLNTAPCGFISYTDDNTIVAANRTLHDLLGYDAPELLGRSVESILTLASRIFCQTHFFPLLKLHEKAEEIFLSLKANEREDVPVLTNAVRRKRGGLFVTDCIFVPVHQRRRYEDEILQAKRAAEEALRNNEELVRAKRQLEEQARELDRRIHTMEQKHRDLTRLSNIFSHDLREPVRKMSIFADLLKEENLEVLTPAGLTAIERIHTSCNRMDRLIGALRDYLSIDTNREPLQEVDLDGVVKIAVRKVLERTGIESLDVKSEGLPSLEGRRKQLVKLFGHLIDNSIKFCQPGVEPSISIRGQVIRHNAFRTLSGKYRYADFVQIVFRDNSVGFESKYSEQAFKAVTKLERNTPGLGMGLAIVKKVVESHQGTISVESEVGRGVKYTILLPVRQLQY